MSKNFSCLIYGINYSPELTGIGKYTGEMAVWLSERGHDVQVVTAPPYYPEWRIAEGYSGRWFRSGRLAGVRVLQTFWFRFLIDAKLYERMENEEKDRQNKLSENK